MKLIIIALVLALLAATGISAPSNRSLSQYHFCSQLTLKSAWKEICRTWVAWSMGWGTQSEKRPTHWFAVDDLSLLEKLLSKGSVLWSLSTGPTDCYTIETERMNELIELTYPE